MGTQNYETQPGHKKPTCINVHVLESDIDTVHVIQVWTYHSSQKKGIQDYLLNAVEIPPCYCTHDCCGHLFTSSLHIYFPTKGIAVVRHVAYRNV